MELRYITSGIYYIPQIKKEGEWVNIVFGGNLTTPIAKLAQAIADIDGINYARWGEDEHQPFYFSNTKVIFFKKEMYVMAFLGGFKSYFSNQVTEYSS